jgi:hypothetical protein
MSNDNNNNNDAIIFVAVAILLFAVSNHQHPNHYRRRRRRRNRHPPRRIAFYKNSKSDEMSFSVWGSSRSIGRARIGRNKSAERAFCSNTRS